MYNPTLTPKAQLMADHRHWYDHAWERIEAKAYELGCDPSDLAAVLAITSPRVQVARNWRIAVHYFEHGELPSGVLGRVRRNVEQWAATGKITGPKVKAYYRALTGDPNAVVLDTWMAKLFGVDQRALPTKQVREPIIKRINAAADKLGWEPREVQAALWAWVMTNHRRRVSTY